MLAAVLAVSTLLAAPTVWAQDDACTSAYAKVQAFGTVCKCPSGCTGGTGSCDVDEGEQGRCTGECEEVCDPATCGTTECSDAAESLATNVDEVVNGLATCTGELAQYASIANAGAAYFRTVAIKRFTDCGLEVPLSLAPDPTTCSGAVQILSSMSSACPGCSDACTGGTGSCDVGEGEEGRCTGECEEVCDPTQCGTKACSDAAESLGTNVEKMMTAFESCTGSFEGYSVYAKYPAAYLTGVARDRLGKCGLDLPASLVESCPTNGCSDTCTEAPKDCDALFTMMTTGCAKDCTKCKKRRVCHVDEV